MDNTIFLPLTRDAQENHLNVENNHLEPLKQKEPPCELEVNMDRIVFRTKENSTTLHSTGYASCYGLIFQGHNGCGLAHIPTIDTCEDIEGQTENEIIDDILKQAKTIDCFDITLCVNVEFPIHMLLEDIRYDKENAQEEPYRCCHFIGNHFTTTIEEEKYFIQNLFKKFYARQNLSEEDACTKALETLISPKFITFDSIISIDVNGNINISNELPETNIRNQNHLAPDDVFFIDRPGWSRINIIEKAKEALKLIEQASNLRDNKKIKQAKELIKKAQKIEESFLRLFNLENNIQIE